MKDSGINYKNIHKILKNFDECFDLFYKLLIKGIYLIPVFTTV